MSLSEILMKHTNQKNVNDICVNIILKDNIFPFAFIREETDDCLVIDNTDENGFEKVVIIPKKNIITVSVVYQDELDAIFDDTFDEQEKKLYQ